MTRNSAIDATKIGANMRAAREAKGISRAELARKVNMYPNLIRCYETMEVCPGADKLILLANALGIGLDEYVAGIVTRTPPNEPLTLEQLRDMDGEPVWVTPLGFWALVIAKPGERVKLICNDGEIVYADKEIELVGPVYRRPPEGEEDN